MTPERYSQIKSIFQQALELPAAQVESFLEEACGPDKELRQEVESLLAVHRETGVVAPDPDNVAELASQLPLEGVVAGGRIGPYRIVREIGRGGMLTVYEAVRDQDEFHQRVAIKLVKRGMDSDMILLRFRTERQILARLEHPNIARLLDGGATEDGQPYFAMEFVEGEPIDEYCRKNQLNLNGRLKLFQQVASAVHYAHQNLVVHRDLKPSNILVTSTGTVKLLDFGIAKVLRAEPGEGTTGLTGASQRPMTPEYASPEQVRGESITTATDVYSLGIVLYELLCGERPYRIESRLQSEIERIICLEEPARPSTATKGPARRELAGDLDNIVLMALRKEPRFRYGSVEQFREDVQRYLEGLPVIARRPTTGYRAWKFVRRNKGAVTAAALVAASLAGGIATTTQQARRAERRFAQVRHIANTFLFEFHSAIATLPGSTPARQLLVKKALEYLESLAPETSGEDSLRLELGRAYRMVGEVQGAPATPNLGDSRGALESYRKALGLLEPLAVRRSDVRVKAFEELSTLLIRFGDIEIRQGEINKARSNFENAVAYADRLVGERPADVGAWSLAGGASLKLGDFYRGIHSYGQAEPHYRRAAEKAGKVLAIDPRDRVALGTRVLSALGMAELYYLTGKHKEAIDQYSRVVESIDAEAAATSPSAGRARVRGLALMRRGEAIARTGDYAGASSSLRLAATAFENLYNADPANAQARYDLPIALALLGAAESFRGRGAEARKATIRSISILRESADRPSATPQDWNNYAASLLNAIPRDLRDAVTALRYANRAAAATSHSDPVVLENLARSKYETGDKKGAVETLKQAIGLLPSPKPGEPVSTMRQAYEARLNRYVAGKPVE
jgi:tetratricopeptide (TPR) repeat protein